MIKNLGKIISGTLFVLGLLAFLHPALGQLVYLDMFEGLIYLILGAVGFKLFFDKKSSQQSLKNFYTTVGLISLGLLLLGLSWPNFKDIFHLEPAENVLHLLLTIICLLLSDKIKLVKPRLF